ncbi:MAG: hypothetical protein ACW98F_00205 [Candidatus Hodarchaeales archaeon]|jgi:hypothetical protein
MKAKDMSVAEAKKELYKMNDIVYMDEFMEGEIRVTLTGIYGERRRALEREASKEKDLATPPDEFDHEGLDEDELLEEAGGFIEEDLDTETVEIVEEMAGPEEIPEPGPAEESESPAPPAPEPEPDILPPPPPTGPPAPAEEEASKLELNLDQIISILEGFYHGYSGFFRKGSGRMAPSLPSEQGVLKSLGVSKEYMPIIADWANQIRNYHRPPKGRAPVEPLPSRIIARRILSFKK